MSQYTPKTWTTGETITAAELNAIEQAAAAAAVKVDSDAAYDAKGAATTAQAAAVAAAATDATTKANAVQATAVQRANHTGTQSADTLTDGSTNKAFLATERTKLAGVATGATANSTDAQLRDRSTHTGTQAATTITGLATVATTGAYADLSGRPAAGIAALTPTATKTAAYTASVGDLAMMNVAGGTTVLTLPAAPADKAQVGYRAIGATNAVPLTINRGGSDTIGTAGATSASIVMPDETVVLQYDSANTRWLGIASVRTQASVDARYGGPYGLAVGSSNCTVPIGTHAGLFGNFQSNGTDTSATYRVFVPLSDPTASAVLPVFANQPNFGSTGDHAPPNPITIAAAVELSDGTVVPFYFNGQHTVTISGGQFAIPDTPINFGAQLTDGSGNLAGLTGVYLRTYVSVTANRGDSVTTTSGSATVTDASITAADQGRRVTGTGIPALSYVGTVTAGVSFLLSSFPDTQVNVNATASGTVTATLQSFWPLNYDAFANGEKVNSTNGPDVTVDGSAAGNGGFGGSNSKAYGPALLLGLTPKTGRKPIVASLTDSIFYGTSDSGIGPVARACAQYGFGHVKLSKVGETAAAYSTPAGRKYRMSLVPGCTHAVIELGTNDGVDTLPKATTLQANLTTLLNYLNSIGIKSLVTTVPPKGNGSTDGYATTAAQTPYNTAAGLSQINTWIRGLPGALGVIGIIEMGDALSSARDSGLWAQASVGRHLTDLATTSGSNVVTSATANFTSADVGFGIYVTGAYTNNLAIIGGVTNSTTVTINNGSATGAVFNAGATVTAAGGGVGAWYATQDGTHPSKAMMSGGVLTAVQNALAGLSI